MCSFGQSARILSKLCQTQRGIGSWTIGCKSFGNYARPRSSSVVFGWWFEPFLNTGPAINTCGSTINKGGKIVPETVYISGPMTGLPDFNKAEFDVHADRLRREGFIVISPAETDGGDTSKPWTYYIKQDIRALLDEGGSRVYMMPGGHNSRGARLEFHIAVSLNIPIYNAVTGEPWDESILQEAQRLVHGDRGEAYGHPFDDFGRTALMASALLADKLSTPLVQEDIAMLMNAV